MNEHDKQISRLNGVSGGGIWKIIVDPDTGNILLPQLVGSVSEHHPRRSAIVGTPIEHGVAAFDDVKTRIRVSAR